MKEKACTEFTLSPTNIYSLTFSGCWCHHRYKELRGRQSFWSLIIGTRRKQGNLHYEVFFPLITIQYSQKPSTFWRWNRKESEPYELRAAIISKVYRKCRYLTAERPSVKLLCSEFNQISCSQRGLFSPRPTQYLIPTRTCKRAWTPQWWNTVLWGNWRCSCPVICPFWGMTCLALWKLSG